MKKNPLLLFLIAIVFSLQSCDEGIILTLPVEMPPVEVELPAIPTTGDFTVGPIPIPTNFDSIAAANDIQKSRITSVKVKSVTYTMITPVDANFNQIKSLANFASTQDLPEIRFAFIDYIPHDGLNKLNLTADDVELKDYVLNDDFLLTIKGNNDAAISSPMVIRLDITLEAKADVLE